MDAERTARQAKRRELLRQLAELGIEEMIEGGQLLGTPHYSVIEAYARTLGRELSREAQERAAREVAARSETEAACPTCQAVCRVETQQRSVTSMDGPVEITEATAYCPKCRRSFFPSASRPGTR